MVVVNGWVTRLVVPLTCGDSSTSLQPEAGCSQPDYWRMKLGSGPAQRSETEEALADMPNGGCRGTP